MVFLSYRERIIETSSYHTVCRHLVFRKPHPIKDKLNQQWHHILSGMGRSLEIHHIMILIVTKLVIKTNRKTCIVHILILSSYFSLFKFGIILIVMLPVTKI